MIGIAKLFSVVYFFSALIECIVGSGHVRSLLLVTDCNMDICVLCQTAFFLLEICDE